VNFSKGDKVVHPHHGPGRVVNVERKEIMDGTKRYYVIFIPGQGLTVQLPVRNADKAGMRPAMPRSSLRKVLRTLRSTPRHMPKDFRVRQEETWDRLKTGRAMTLARVVRDLTWHRELEHLTKKDGEYLKLGQKLLAEEMALVSDDEVEDTSALIESTMTAAVAADLPG
jgi:CarD family transcriptional regulator